MSFLIFVENALRQSGVMWANSTERAVLKLIRNENRNLSFKVHCLALTNFSCDLGQVSLILPTWIYLSKREWTLLNAGPTSATKQYSSCHERYTVIIRAVSNRPFSEFQKTLTFKMRLFRAKSPWENDFLHVWTRIENYFKISHL